jgi:Copper chaperone
MSRNTDDTERRQGEGRVMDDVVFSVAGMSCASCERRVEAALGRLDGVRVARADHERGEVRVVFEPARSPEESVRGTIAAAGYEVTS